VSFHDVFTKYVLPRSSFLYSKACHAIFSILYSFSLINGLTDHVLTIHISVEIFSASVVRYASACSLCARAKRHICLELSMKSTEVTIKVQLDRFLQLCQGCKVLCFAVGNIIDNWANSLHVGNVQGTQMRTRVIHFVSEMLRGTQMTTEVIHFMSEMLRGTQMTTGVIHFLSEIIRGTQVTTGVIHFVSEMLRGTQMRTGVIVSEMLRGTQMTSGVIHFMSEMLRGTQMTTGVIHFVSEILRGTQVTTGVIRFVSKMLRVRKASHLFWN